MAINKYMLYARVSPKGSTWDAEETSIGVQFADMRAHILRLDPAAEFIEVADEYTKWKGSGKSRKEFLETIAKIEGIYV